MRAKIEHRSWPIIEQDDYDAVKEVLDSGSLLKSGVQREALEAEFIEFTGTTHALAVDSCTHGLHAAYAACGVGPGSKVAVPALTFEGTIHPVLQLGAVPVFVDVDVRTFNMDPDLLQRALEAHSDIDLVVPVHLHGLMCDMTRIMGVCDSANVPVVEDACHVPGVFYGDRHAGTIGWAGVFSLNEVKNLAGGQGGIITTHDHRLAAKVQDLRSYGKGDPNSGGRTSLGFSYGITELAAAVTRSQLRRLPQHIENGRRNAIVLTEGLRSISSVNAPFVPEGREHGWHKYRITVNYDSETWPGLTYFERWNATTAVVEELNTAGMPCHFWQRTPMDRYQVYYTNGSPPSIWGDHDKYSGKNVAAEVAACSFLLGSEQYPIIAQTESTMKAYVEVMREVFGRFDEILYKTIKEM